MKVLEAVVRMPCDELDLLKRRQSANCDLEVMAWNAADAQSDITGMVTGWHRKTVSSYELVRRKVNSALVEVSRRLKEAFECEAWSLEQNVRSTDRD